MGIIIGIYKITSPIGKVYIGQSIDMKKRWWSYSKLHCKNQRKLYSSLIEFSYEKHKLEIIEECSLDQLDEREAYWKKYYLNILGWDKILFFKLIDGRGGKLSEETCLKKSISMKGKYIRKGAVLSKETKDLMRLTAKGKPKPWLKGRKIRWRPVEQLNTDNSLIKYWPNIKEVEEKLGIFTTSIISCCRGRNKTAGGFKWKYK